MGALWPAGAMNRAPTVGAVRRMVLGRHERCAWDWHDAVGGIRMVGKRFWCLQLSLGRTVSRPQTW